MDPKSKPVDGVLAIFGKAAPKGAAKPEAEAEPDETAEDVTESEDVPPAAGACLDELKIPTDAHAAWCRFVRAVMGK